MSTDYYASFTPVPLNRETLLSPLSKLFSEMSALLDPDCYRLELKNEQFEYTGEEMTCESLVDILMKTCNWDGVEINLVYEHQLCSLIIANDIEDKTTVFFCEPRKLFEKQWNNPLNRFNFLKFLTHFMKMLGASFCILEPGWVRRSRTNEDIEKWLHDINQGFARDWELVVIQDLFISRQPVSNFAKHYFLETLPPPRLNLSNYELREYPNGSKTIIQGFS